MKLMTCWICHNNLIFKDYIGTKLLDEEGNKPCFECYLEDEESLSESDDNTEEESE